MRSTERRHRGFEPVEGWPRFHRWRRGACGRSGSDRPSTAPLGRDAFWRRGQPAGERCV